MADYEQLLLLLSTWSGIPFAIAFQESLFSHPTIPLLLRFIIANRDLLGRQLSPKYGTLALRAACPTQGCGLAEKHGRLNVYNENGPPQDQRLPIGACDTSITFHSPHHGPHTIHVSNPADLARLEANTPARNLIRTMRPVLTHVLPYLGKR
ncbi:MAG: hypothetical protein M1829_005096 [Trizodia sp. TS-e1964]|nr:MAG: hypothetical protein M1829_005096 [Trizodia sp. TS-e1964]